MRAARFPDHTDTDHTNTDHTNADHTNADPAGLARAASLAGRAGWTAQGGMPGPAGAGDRPGATVWVSPVRAAWQTAAAMGLEAREAPALREADCGRWGGLTYEQVAREEPEALAGWLADPHAAPHGGESLAALAERVGDWLEAVRESPTRPEAVTGRAQPGMVAGAVPSEVVVICDVGVIRAALGHALGLDPPSAARFDIAPLSFTELTVTRTGWRVAHVNRKVLSWSTPTRSARSSGSMT
ncbi:histidine phosphatase family protein [Nonomuraea sp. NPDC049709]|uniref:histidine phosphatase family protein n=1 Tax=Nonomuraea sp. NPDC049709 TaxID=3154736 RepID=UPI003412E8BE